MHHGPQNPLWLGLEDLTCLAKLGEMMSDFQQSAAYHRPFVSAPETLPPACETEQQFVLPLILCHMHFCQASPSCYRRFIRPSLNGPMYCNAGGVMFDDMLFMPFACRLGGTGSCPSHPPLLLPPLAVTKGGLPARYSMWPLWGPG